MKLFFSHLIIPLWTHIHPIFLCSCFACAFWLVLFFFFQPWNCPPSLWNTIFSHRIFSSCCIFALMNSIIIFQDIFLTLISILLHTFLLVFEIACYTFPPQMFKPFSFLPKYFSYKNHSMLRHSSQKFVVYCFAFPFLHFSANFNVLPKKPSDYASFYH